MKKNKNKQIGSGLSGLGNSCYYVWVVMTTTGLGDISSTTIYGKIITSALMLFSYISLPILTGFAAVFTTISITNDLSITSIEQLQNKNVAVLEGSSSVPFVQLSGGNTVKVKSIEDGVNLIKRNKVSALVYDKPVLSYMVHKKKIDGMSVSKSTYNAQGYGFATTNHSLQHSLSTSIIKMSESNKFSDIEKKWLGNY